MVDKTTCEVKEKRREWSVSAAKKASPSNQKVSGFPTVVEIRSDPSDFWECSEPSRKVASLSLGPHSSSQSHGKVSHGFLVCILVFPPG